MKKYISRWVSVVVVSLSLTACSGAYRALPDRDMLLDNPIDYSQKSPSDVQGTPQVSVKTTYKIALFLPTKTQNPALKKVSADLLAAAYLAKQDLNNPRLDLLVYQTDGTPYLSQTAARDAISKKVDLILGPLLASDVTQMRPLTEKAKIPMIAFSSDTSTVQGGYSYLLSYLPEQNIEAVTDYALSKGYQTYGVLASNSRYGQLSDDLLKKKVHAKAGTVTNSVLYTLGSPDYQLRLKEFTEIEQRRTDPALKTSYQAIFMPDDLGSVQQVMPTLRQYEVNPQNYLLMGSSLWHEQAALTMPELNKAILAAPDHQKLSAFEQRFTDAYGRTPSPIASLAYDGVALTAALLQQYPSDPFRLDRISNPNGFSGVGGVFRFLTNGVSQRQLNIVQIRDGAFHVLQPAKENFVQ